MINGNHHSAPAGHGHCCGPTGNFPFDLSLVRPQAQAAEPQKTHAQSLGRTDQSRLVLPSLQRKERDF